VLSLLPVYGRFQEHTIKVWYFEYH
jgi:hypothetical protein